MPTSAEKRPSLETFRMATTGAATERDKQHRDAKEAYAQQLETLSASLPDLPYVLQHNLNTSNIHCRQGQGK